MTAAPSGVNASHACMRLDLKVLSFFLLVGIVTLLSPTDETTEVTKVGYRTVVGEEDGALEGNW